MEEMKQYSQCNYKRLKGHFDMETDPYQNVTGFSCDRSLKRHIFCLSINFVWQNQTDQRSCTALSVFVRLGHMTHTVTLAQRSIECGADML